MDKKIHPIYFYNGCNYLSMLGLRLSRVSKRGPCRLAYVTFYSQRVYTYIPVSKYPPTNAVQWRLTQGGPGERIHDDIIKWKHFPRCWSFVRGIHRSPVNSPHKGQLRGALMFSLICAWINGWVNNRGAGDLRRHRAHHDVTVMFNKYSGRHLGKRLLVYGQLLSRA